MVHMIWLALKIFNKPNDGTILRKRNIEMILSGTHVNFDIGMQPYTVTQYGQSSTVRFR